MELMRSYNYYSLFLSLTFLINPLSSVAEIYDLFLSEDELCTLIDNPNQQYVCLDKQLNDIAYIVKRLSSIEQNQTSPLFLLNKYINQGFTIGLYDEIVATLEYAQTVLHTNKNKLSADEYHVLSEQLHNTLAELMVGNLTLNNDEITRDAHCHQLPTITLHKGLKLLGKAVFKCEVSVDHKLKAKNKSSGRADLPTSGLNSIIQ